MKYLVLALVVSLGACGDDDAAPADAAFDVLPADANEVGTATLLLVGSITVDNSSNIQDPAALQVRVDVILTKDGMPQSNAQININPAPPAIQILLTEDVLDPGHYRGNYINYQLTARIRASANQGDDFFADVTLPGPMLHHVEQPVVGATPPAGTDLHVSWNRPEGAVMQSELRTLHHDVPDLGDPGVYEVPGSALMSGEDDFVEVIRARHDLLGVGAAPGSFIDFQVLARQEFTVQ